MTAAIVNERWWGSALLAVAREAVRRRQRDDACRRAGVELLDAVVRQARYLHGVCGTWPTAIATPHRTLGIGYVRVRERYKPSGRFALGDPELVTSSRAIDIKVNEVRNSDGFWAAEIPGRADPVLFWPAPKEPPEWWEAR